MSVNIIVILDYQVSKCQSKGINTDGLLPSVHSCSNLHSNKINKVIITNLFANTVRNFKEFEFPIKNCRYLLNHFPSLLSGKIV